MPPTDKMNRLEKETSPYLLQHKNNPVHWQPWDDAAFAAAQEGDKPVLLSVGYAACHWCHVMAHESFEDPATADLMNAHFICVKVDREERPDIDALYQQALALTGQQGGWPLTMFLTPDKKPFWGGTYFPPHARHGLPSFREVLRGVADAWRQERDKISFNAESLSTALQSLQDRHAAAPVVAEHLPKIRDALLARVDAAHGGFGADGPKFPTLPALHLLWDCALRLQDGHARAAVIQALTAMCQGGIYDHVGGGIARYAVDAEWHVPHFEKMLYDNALFVSLLTDVWRDTQNPLFAARVAETVAWMLRELRVEKDGDAAFAASFDADSADDGGHQSEGAFYIWRAADIDAVLGEDAAFFREVFNITPFGNWTENAGYNIPDRLHRPIWRDAEEERKIFALLRKLRAARDRRTPPARDDKILADWNGMAVSALAAAGFVFGNPAWTDAAASACRFIGRAMTDDTGRLVWRSYCGRPAHRPVLDDIAHLAAGYLSLYETTGDAALLDSAKSLAAQALNEFSDAENGGFFTVSAAQSDMPLRLKTADDTAQPAANAVMLDVLHRLHLHTGAAVYADAATAAARAFSALALLHPFSRGAFIRHSLSFDAALSVHISAGAGRAALDDVLRRTAVAGLAVLPHRNAGMPANGADNDTDKAAAWLCAARRCLPPVTEAAAFREMLLAGRDAHPRPPANDG